MSDRGAVSARVTGEGGPPCRSRARGHTRPGPQLSFPFSERIVERFLRPFFSGVFREPDLVSSSRMLSFAPAMFARGAAALPAEGMGAVPTQLAARLERGTIRLRAPVERAPGGGVVLASGEELEAKAVVIATDVEAAARLAPEVGAPGRSR
jgi:phytoene dehydrogenase-like protein